VKWEGEEGRVKREECGSQEIGNGSKGKNLELRESGAEERG